MSMFEVVERLHSEFGPGRARFHILAVVESCAEELDAAPQGGRPAALELLTRQHVAAHD